MNEDKKSNVYHFFVRANEIGPILKNGKRRLFYRLYVSRRFILENRIESKQELFKLNDLPFIGEIYYVKRFFEEGIYPKGKNSSVATITIPKKIWKTLELKDGQKIRFEVCR
jgi:hypothetical protein